MNAFMAGRAQMIATLQQTNVELGIYRSQGKEI